MTLKKRVRSVIAVVMALCLLVTGVSASAVNEATEEGASVQPRWAAVVTMYAGLDFNWLGGAKCTGGVDLENGFTGNLTVTLQRSADEFRWEDIKEWTATGSGTISIDKTYYVVSGYYYEVKVSVDTYNAAGTYIETVTLFSNTVYH